MCCTIAIGGMPAGNRGSSVRRASMPPVEPPITISWRSAAFTAGATAGMTGAAGGGGVGPRERNRADWAAALT
jgi:hypothetical protein